MAKDQHSEILKRAILLRDKLDDLTAAIQHCANNAALAVVRLESTNPDYLGIPLPGTCDLVVKASSADRTASGLETLLFQLIDDRKLT